MKHALRMLTILLVAGLASPCGAQTKENPAKEPPASPPKEKVPAWKLARDFAACPAGHTKLKDVPILYGLVGPLIKKPEEYNAEDKELDRKRKNGEVVFGGDYEEPGYARSRVTCAVCGFYYDQHGRELPPEHSEWSRSAGDMKGFTLPFSKLLLSLPVLTPVPGTLKYSQSVPADGKTLFEENVEYHVVLPEQEVVDKIRAWMKSHHLNSKELLPEEAPTSYEYHGDENGIWMRVEKDGWYPDQIWVRFSKSHRDLPTGGK